MTALPDAARCLLLRFKGTYGAGSWNNVLHAQYTGTAPTQTQLEALATQLASQWNTSFGPLESTGAILTEVNVVDLTNATSPSAIVEVNFPGTRAGELLLAQVAACGSWKGNLRFRGGHWRSYFVWGVRTDADTLRLWTDAFTVEATAAMRGFRTALNGMSAGTAPLVMVGMSYIHDKNPRPVPLAIPIVDGVMHHRLDTQRRRLGKETG